MHRIGIIGPGRVGGALALALSEAGHTVVSVAGRDQESDSVARVRRLIPDSKPARSAEVPRGVDLIVVAVPDDSLTTVVAELLAADTIVPGQKVLHTAGGHGVDVLTPLVAAGARVAACHPAVTFPDVELGRSRLIGASWAVTAADADVLWAQAFVTDLGGRPVRVAQHSRPLYHAALAVGSNGTTAVVTMARDLLLGAGITDPAAFLLPLVTASAQGGAANGVAALTGPIRRGDVGTVVAHLDELGTSFPELVDAYLALGQLILTHSERAGLSHAASQAIGQLLWERGSNALFDDGVEAGCTSE